MSPDLMSLDLGCLDDLSDAFWFGPAVIGEPGCSLPEGSLLLDSLPLPSALPMPAELLLPQPLAAAPASGASVAEAEATRPVAPAASPEGPMAAPPAASVANSSGQWAEHNEGEEEGEEEEAPRKRATARARGGGGSGRARNRSSSRHKSKSKGKAKLSAEEKQAKLDHLRVRCLPPGDPARLGATPVVAELHAWPCLRPFNRRATV